MDEAIEEHAEAKQLIAQIGKMHATAKDYDATVKRLGKAIDQHVLESVSRYSSRPVMRRSTFAPWRSTYSSGRMS